MSSSNGDSPMPPPAAAAAAPRGESPTGSPRRLSTSLQAAATMNAGLQHEPSRRSSSGSLSRSRHSHSAGRRRSTVLMNLQLNDPSVPGPGEMVADNQPTHSGGATTASPQPMASSPMMVAGGDPHHNRAPSLGELHQELEAEQEAQVNRLLGMIRQQQLQLQQLQATQGQGSSAIEDSAIASERSNQGTPVSQPASAVPPSGFSPLPPSGSFSRSPGVPHHPRSSFDVARADIQRRSRTPSRGASPRLRSTSISGDSGDHWVLGGRDESAFYQAETQMLVRENQMLRHRIRDLERQVTELVPGKSGQGNPSEPAHPSQLMRATSAGEDELTTARATPSIVAGSSAGEAAKETSINGLSRARRGFSSTASARADFTHIVVGGGAVGLATARALAQRPGTSTVLLERHGAVGTETSSRNSEVIHAGIYYGAGTLKTELCVRGKELLYAFCRERDVGHANTGKWIVAQTPAQREALERVHGFCKNEINVPIRWVAAEEARRLEPDVRGETGILESPTTGIVDSHGLMVALMGLFEDAGGVVALSSAVTGVKPLGDRGSQGWEVQVRDSTTGEESAVTAEVLVNSAGLGSVDVHNMIVPPEERRELFYAKGNYFSYSSSKPKVGRLIYPAPEPGAGGLGTHLTLDLGGRVRFGPDVEWADSPDDLAVNTARLPLAIEAIKKYLPDLDESCLEPDYTGIRPKLGQRGAVGSGSGFHDFVIRREEGYEGWVNLLGIESPGLTSCLAIAERVDRLLYG
ncbi:putative FAD dependent oxidoreductase [Colletotrichum karsti]|uniref:L-2-hydroxyglutarate dehydrogenase, mitochondrial n=1 Tax=Colletotrichum karsti TaxID=1095194 RepID=A0A9P6LE76_9PEZI|nr:putative FAD dependent oxidoreductase [Colletotrichum karsti]KAF9870073.1 putative FAD dependent oxidoreductase [Colletotrichum karsti]